MASVLHGCDSEYRRIKEKKGDSTSNLPEHCRDRNIVQFLGACIMVSFAFPGATGVDVNAHLIVDVRALH